MDCIFCKIINNEIPSYTVFEDDIVKVFLNINPDTNGHLLIIPKKHVLALQEIDNETLLHIMEIARKMQKQLKEKLNIDGLTLIQNNGDAQEVKHYHLHLVPFYNKKQELNDIRIIYEKLTK